MPPLPNKSDTDQKKSQFVFTNGVFGSLREGSKGEESGEE